MNAELWEKAEEIVRANSNSLSTITGCYDCPDYYDCADLDDNSDTMFFCASLNVYKKSKELIKNLGGIQ